MLAVIKRAGAHATTLPFPYTLTKGCTPRNTTPTCPALPHTPDEHYDRRAHVPGVHGAHDGAQLGQDYPDFQRVRVQIPAAHDSLLCDQDCPARACARSGRANKGNRYDIGQHLKYKPAMFAQRAANDDRNCHYPKSVPLSRSDLAC